MAEAKPSVAITVAIIGLVGALGAALIANWGKVFGTPQLPPPTRDERPAPDAPQPAPEALRPTPVAPQPTPPEVQRAPVEPTRNISGTWRDTNYPGTSSQVTQDGNSFRFTRHGILPNGVAFDASGTGTLDGQRYKHTYTAQYQTGGTSTGDCSGMLSADGARVDMSCNDTLLGIVPVTAVRE